MLKNPPIGELLRTAVKEAGVPVSVIAERCGISPQGVYAWYRSGRIAKKHLQTVAAITNKPLAYFLGGRADAVELSPEEWRIIQRFRSSSEEGKTFIKSAAEAASMAHPISQKRRI